MNRGANEHEWCDWCQAMFPRWAGTATGDAGGSTATPQTNPLIWEGRYLCGPCADERGGRYLGPFVVFGVRK